MASDSSIKSKSGRAVLDVMAQAAQEAGKILVKNFRKGLRVSRKERGNFLSEADILSEKRIMEILADEFPGCRFISEESFPEYSPGPNLTFIIDPLDGTNNYCFGIPYFCVNVALIQEGEVTLGMVYDPLRKETFLAKKGKGAYLNKRKISVSDRTSLQESLPGFDFGYSDIRGKEVLNTVMGLWPGVHSFRAMGSSSIGLCYVAGGRLDMYFHRCLFPWDIAPGMLLVREAGGIVTDWEGREASPQNSQIIAGSPAIHRQFMQWLKEHPVNPRCTD